MKILFRQEFALEEMHFTQSVSEVTYLEAPWVCPISSGLRFSALGYRVQPDPSHIAGQKLLGVSGGYMSVTSKDI